MQAVLQGPSMASAIEEYRLITNKVRGKRAKQSELRYFTPNEAVLNNYYGTTQTITFDCATSTYWVDPSQSFIQGSFQLLDSTTKQPYAPGSAIAFNPSLASLMCDQYTFSYGDVIETGQSPAFLPTFIDELLTRSYDYTQGEKGLVDGFILDAAGQTQYSPISTTLPMSPINVSYTVAGTTYTAPLKITIDTVVVLGFIPPAGSPTPSGVCTLSTASGIPINAGYLSIDATYDPTAPASATTPASIPLQQITVGAASGGSYVLNFTFIGTTIIPEGTSYTFTLSTAGFGDIVVYSTLSGASNSLTSCLLFNQIQTAAPSSTALIQIQGNIQPDANLLNGTLYAYIGEAPTTTSSVSFWKRQALTNGNSYFNFRIPLNHSMVKYLRNDPPPMMGQNFYLQLNLTPSSVASMIMRDPSLNPPLILVNDLQLVLKAETPENEMFNQLNSFLNSDASFDFNWIGSYLQPMQFVSAGQSQINNVFNLPLQKFSSLIFAFIPTAYISQTNGLVNPLCSLVPQGTNTSWGNPLTDGRLTYLGSQIPPNYVYGQLRSDVQREFYEFLKLSDRLDQDLLAPCFDLNTYLQNYFFLTFDLSGIEEKENALGSNATVSLTFAQAFSQQMNVYVIANVKHTTTWKGLGGKMFSKTL